MDKNQVDVFRPAKYLTSYSLTLIRRRSLLKALISRCTKMIEKIEAKLWPRVDMELGSKENKAVVQVHMTIVELSRTLKVLPKYKDICEVAIDPSKLKEILEKLDAAGEYVFKTKSKSFNARLVGRSESVLDLLRKAA